MQNNLFTSDLAEIKVSYSIEQKASQRRKVTSSQDAIEVFRQVWEPGTMELRECFYVLLLTRANTVLGYKCISQGGVSGTVADPRLIFAMALKCNASSIILSHNHPSGNTQPSSSDLELTKKIVEGGKILEITVLDHLILTAESHYSFADDGLI